MRRVLPMILLVLGTGLSMEAGEWPNWRGPYFSGVAPEGEYPIKWNRDENILWKQPMPAHAGSTPIVCDGRIVLTAPLEGNNGILCFDTEGKRLWDVQLGPERPGKHRKGSGSNPSPVTDGEFVFVYYKSGELAALDFDGHIKWRTNLQERFAPDNLWWDLGTSPVLTERAVVVACMQTGDSYLVAFEKQTGDVLWKVDRNLDAPLEANQSYTTPLVVNDQGEEQIITLGADHVTAHRAADGEAIWQVGGLNPGQEKFFRSIASPVLSGDLVIAPYARGGTLTAIRMGGKGDVTDTHVVWSREGVSADVPTPAAHQGKIYVCGDRGQLWCLRDRTGETLWETKTPRSRSAFSASPVLAGDHLYLTREDGMTFVVAADGSGRLVASNPLEELTVATPVFVDDRIYLRTSEHLWAIGK